MKIEYAWLPPHESVGIAKPNQVEVVFTAHAKAAFERRQRAGQIDIAPGATCIVGAEAITWSKIEEPNESLGIELPDATSNGSKLSETAIRTVCGYIEEHLCRQITLEALAALVHISPFHFARCFKATLGLAPHQYVIARRMELAKRLLLSTTLNVAEIGWSIGYENTSHVRRLFALHIGMTPGAIRRAVGIQQRA